MYFMLITLRANKTNSMAVEKALKKTKKERKLKQARQYFAKLTSKTVFCKTHKQDSILQNSQARQYFEKLTSKTVF